MKVEVHSPTKTKIVPIEKVTGRKRKKKADPSEPWWCVPDGDRGAAVKATIDAWWEQHAPRRQEYQTIIEQYEAAEVGALTPADYAPEGRRAGGLRYNVMRSVVDTLTSRYSKEKPRPVAMTEKGKWRHKRHAKELNKIFFGILQQNGVYRAGRQLFRDAVALQMGVFKSSVHPQTDDIEIERIFPGELLWDLADAFRGNPTEIAHVFPRSRHVMMAKYKKHKEAIKDAAGSRTGRQQKHGTCDLVDVVEIWKLPSYRGAGDGRRCIVVDEVVLVDEEWTFDRFPLSIMRFSSSFRGFAGNGLGSVLMGFQLSVNKHLLADEEAVERGSKLRCFVYGDDGEVQISKLESDVNGAIFHIKNTQHKPEFDPGRSLDPQKVEYNRWLISSAYDVAGLTQLSASGQKPAGVDAAVAMRELQDIEALRFMEQQSEYEEVFIDLAEVILMYTHTYWAGKGKAIKVRGRGFIEKVNFDDIQMPRDEFEIGVFAASMLPKQPGARQQRLQEMVDNKIISIPRMMVLMEMPDIDGEAELRAAPLTDIDATIAHFLEDDPRPEQLKREDVRKALESIRKIEDVDEREMQREQVYADLLYMAPTGIEALDEGIVRFTNAYLLARHSDVPPPRLNLLSDWIAAAKEIQAAAAMAGQANAIGAGPSGTPGMPAMPGAPMQPQAAPMTAQGV